jgi:FKBP-type peptidyl-prolyl cis-trans isomerase FkpA
MSFAKSSIPLWLSILMVFISGCKAPVQERKEDPGTDLRRMLLKTNQYMRERHREHMVAFADRTGWEMTETPTGLWYMVLEEGHGPGIQRENLVTYTCETRLIDGQLCYAADTNSPKKIVIGKGGVEAGLEEGLLLLKEGDKARFIIPPYLAHGNFGDGAKIPGSAILLMEVQVLSVKR